MQKLLDDGNEVYIITSRGEIKFKGSEENARLAETMGFESDREYNEIMFLREITHTVNALNDMGDIVRLYSKNPDTAAARLSVLLSGEDSDSV